MNVIIFGPPGAGKGTQANKIVKKFNLYQVSTGDLLRDEVKNQTQIGKDIENIISKGDFATDEIVNELIKNIVFDPIKKNKLICLLYTSPSPRDPSISRMPSSA